MITGEADATITKGHIFIGTSPEVIEEFVGEGDIVLVTNRYEAQICAIECGASCVVICCGSLAGKSVLNRAKEKQCAILTTPYDTYVAARLINTAIPVRHIMQSENILQFGVNTYVEDAKKNHGQRPPSLFSDSGRSGKIRGGRQPQKYAECTSEARDFGGSQ